MVTARSLHTVRACTFHMHIHIHADTCMQSYIVYAAHKVVHILNYTCFCISDRSYETLPAGPTPRTQDTGETHDMRESDDISERQRHVHGESKCSCDVVIIIIMHSDFFIPPIVAWPSPH